MGKPSYPGWIPDNSTNISTPPSGQLTVGWLPLQKPPSQYFNWFFNLVSQWVNFTGPGAPDVIVGSASYCTHATLAAAVADSGVGSNVDVLITQNDTTGSTITLSKSGWRIRCLSGVTFVAGGGGAGGLSVTASYVQLQNLRFSGFTTAITFGSAANYGRVNFCNFSSCTTDITDNSTSNAMVVGSVDE